MVRQQHRAQLGYIAASSARAAGSEMEVGQGSFSQASPFHPASVVDAGDFEDMAAFTPDATPSPPHRARYYPARIPSLPSDPSFTSSEFSLVDSGEENMDQSMQSTAVSDEANDTHQAIYDNGKDRSSDSHHSFVRVSSEQQRMRALRPALTRDISADETEIAPERPPSNPPTARDWENHRRVFTQIYLDQGKTLQQARALMEERYSFVATERMYKKRIRDWDLQKYKQRKTSNGSDNGSSPSSSQPARTRRTRRPSRRSSSEDQTLDSNDDQALISATRGSLEKALDSYIRSKYPNMDLARLMQINLDLKNVEVILSQIDNYYKSYSDEMWTRTFPKTARGSIKEIPLALDIAVVKKTAATPMVRHPGELFNRIHMAAQLFNMESQEANDIAWRIIFEAFSMLQDVVHQQHPQLPRYLFMQFWDHTFDTHPAIRDVREQLFRYMNLFAEVDLGPRHPLTLITRLLPSVQHPPQVCELAWRRKLDTFDSVLGPNHDENLRSKMALTGNYIDAKRYDDCERTLREVMACFDADSAAYYMRAAMCRLAWIFTLQGRYDEAEPIFEDVLGRCRRRAQNQVEKNVLDDIFLAATTHLARIQARRSYREGERRLQEALSLCVQNMGSDHAYTYSIKTELEHLKDVAQADALLNDFTVGTLNDRCHDDTRIIRG